MPVDKTKRRVRAVRPVKQEHSSRKTVTTNIYGNETQTLDVEVEAFDVEPAYVRVNAGRTKNLGNYESLRVDVSITMPCYKETIPEVFEALGEEVESMLDYEVSRYLNDGE